VASQSTGLPALEKSFCKTVNVVSVVVELQARTKRAHSEQRAIRNAVMGALQPLQLLARSSRKQASVMLLFLTICQTNYLNIYRTDLA